jgi:hypothetical protein
MDLPAVDFPRVAVPAAGAPVCPADWTGPRFSLGECVLVRAGAHAGRVAEVVGWGGGRGIELVVHGRVPAFLALAPALVEPVDARLFEPLLPRRPRPGRPAGADGRGLPPDSGPGEAEPGGLGPQPAGGVAAGRRHDQHPLTGSGPVPDHHRQAGLAQPPQASRQR